MLQRTNELAVLGRRDGDGQGGDQHGDVVVGADELARPRWAARNAAMMRYYDNEWGVPVWQDKQVFRILSLLILQAGLFWGSALARAEELANLLGGFDPVTLAQFSDEDVEALLANPQMIRNGRKVRAIVHNARTLESSNPGLAKLVWSFQPETTPRPQALEEVPVESPQSSALARELKSLGFIYVGPRICYSLFQCIGVVDTNLVGTHRRGASGLWAEDGARLAARTPVDVPPSARVCSQSCEADNLSAPQARSTGSAVDE
jgi:DNA-3-methyladenine glycosylase I